MSYTKTVWKDLPDTTTPLNATNLNHMEDGIAIGVNERLPLTGGTITGAMIFSSSVTTQSSIEIYGNTPFLDFHYDNSSTDYTHRIIADNNNWFSVNKGLRINDNNYSMIGVVSELRIVNTSNTNFMPINASAFNVSSSERYKTNIENITENEANKILDINVVKFDYKNGANNQFGVIAEQVVDIIPTVVTLKDIDNKEVPDSVDYSKFVPYLIKKMQRQEEEINRLKNMS